MPALPPKVLKHIYEMASNLPESSHCYPFHAPQPSTTDDMQVFGRFFDTKKGGWGELVIAIIGNSEKQEQDTHLELLIEATKFLVLAEDAGLFSATGVQ